MTRMLVFVFACASVYTFLRYVIFGNVLPENLPVYLLNKSVSMTSVVCLLFTAIYFTKKKLDKVKFWGRASLHSAYIHIILSLSILSKEYYPKFFGLEKMNLTGEITILFGVLAAYCYWLISHTSEDFMHKILQILSSALIVGHLIAMGFNGWLRIEGWHGGLPPISLISFVLATISLILFSRTKFVT